MASIYRTLLREIGAGGGEKVLNARISLGALRKMLLALKVWLKY